MDAPFVYEGFISRGFVTWGKFRVFVSRGSITRGYFMGLFRVGRFAGCFAGCFAGVFRGFISRGGACLFRVGLLRGFILWVIFCGGCFARAFTSRALRARASVFGVAYMFFAISSIDGTKLKITNSTATRSIAPRIIMPSELFFFTKSDAALSAFSGGI